MKLPLTLEPGLWPRRAARALGLLCAGALGASGTTALGAIMLRGRDVPVGVHAALWIGSLGALAVGVGLVFVRGRAVRTITASLAAQRVTADEAASMVRRFFNEAPLLMGMVEVVGDDILHLQSNDATARFLGTEPAAIEGRLASEIGTSRRHITMWLEYYARAKATGESQRFEYTHAARDREYRLASVVSYLGTSASGRDQFSFVVEDISALTLAVEELRAGRERLALAVEGSNDAIWDWDVVSGKAYVSPRYKEILGYRDDELVIDFDEWSSRLHPDDSARVLAELQAHLKAGESYSNVYRLRHRDGGYRWVSSRGEAVRGPSGNAVRMAGTLTDITESHATQRQLEHAFVHAPIGKVLVAPSGRFLKVNPALCSITGYTEQELLERDFQSITHPDDLDSSVAKVTDMFAGQVASLLFEQRYIHRDGRTIWARLSAAAVRSPGGAPELAVALVEDISQQKATEEALRESLAQRDASLEREKTLLRELDHRVRNNLAGLLGLLRLYGRSDGTREEVVSGMAGKVRALTEVHDLITSTPRQAINLRDLLERMQRELVVPGERGGAAAPFRAAGPEVRVPPVQAAALAMILQELFANSIKHGALGVAGGTVELEWNCVAAGAGAAALRRLELVWVESGGPRIAGNPTGSGIGLRLIEGLASSELRGGAVFSFEPPGYVCRIEGLLAPESAAAGGPAGVSDSRGPATSPSYAHGAAS